MQTRRASLADIPWLLEQLWAFDAFCGTKRSLIPMKEGKATSIVAQLVQETYFLIVETPSAGPFGFICGVLTPHMLNPELRIFTELFWWITPEMRGTSAGATLFIEFVDYGKKHADWIIMTLENESPVNPHSLERRGFKLKERNYLLEV